MLNRRRIYDVGRTQFEEDTVWTNVKLKYIEVYIDYFCIIKFIKALLLAVTISLTLNDSML